MLFFTRFVCWFLFAVLIYSGIAKPSLAQGEVLEEEGDANPVPILEFSEVPLLFPIVIVEGQPDVSGHALQDERRLDFEERGLQIQDAIKEATQGIELWTRCGILASVVLGVVGALLLWLTLKRTREANETAQKAVAVTREVGQHQSRAYLHIEKVEGYWGDVTGREFSPLIYVKNTGMTPARWFEVKWKYFKLDRGSKLDSVEKFFAEVRGDKEIKFMRYMALGSQSEWSVRAWPADGEFGEGLYRERKGKRLFVAGVLRYETMYGEVFESEFVFSADPPVYKFERKEGPEEGDTEETRAIKSFGVSVNYFSNSEVPFKFSRPDCNLKAYQRIQ